MSSKYQVERSTVVSSVNQLHSKGRFAHPRKIRATLSCNHCRRNKVKCNRQLPCDTCIRRGADYECQYQGNPSHRGISENTQLLGRRIDALEQSMRKIMNKAEKDGPQDMTEDAATLIENSRALNDLNLAMGQLTYISENHSDRVYSGATAWQNVFTQFEGLKHLFQIAVRTGSFEDESLPITPSSLPPPSNDSVINTGAHSCFPLYNCCCRSLDDVLASLPSPQLTTLLIEKFFCVLLPFNRVVHRATFFAEYDVFRSAPNNVKPEWLALLYTILLSATLSYSPKMFATISGSTISHNEITKIFFSAAKEALVQANVLENHSLTTIQALILLQVGIVPNEMGVSSWGLHGVTRNLAFQAGLHREPSTFDIPEPEAEIRRRIWWCIYIQDRFSCLHKGVSLSWKDCDADCQEPTIVDDDELTANFAEIRHEFPSGTDASFCSMTLFYCQMNIAKLIARVIEMAFSIQKTSYSKILELDHEVERCLQEVFVRVLRCGGPGFDRNLEPISDIMRCFYLKIILLLHRPFIGQSTKGIQFQKSRDRAISTALLIIRSQVKINSTSNFLFDNTWAVKPMIAQSLFPASVVLALDLYTYPDQSNSEEIIQALRDFRYSFFELSKEFPSMEKLYSILNILMAKTWEKLRLNQEPDLEPFASAPYAPTEATFFFPSASTSQNPSLYNETPFCPGRDSMSNFATPSDFSFAQSERSLGLGTTDDTGETSLHFAPWVLWFIRSRLTG